jgi:hypothetical protein
MEYEIFACFKICYKSKKYIFSGIYIKTTTAGKNG